jgi:hypothetical protein
MAAVAATAALVPLSAAAATAVVTSTALQGLTLSPAFASDHTVFAEGVETDPSRCPSPNPLGTQCPVLFRSGDGGHTWTELGSSYPGGQVGLPPAFPTDPTIYAFGSSSASRSDDGGQTFTTIASGPATMLPGGGAGHAHVAIAGNGGVDVYDEATGSTQRVARYPLGFTVQDTASQGPAAIVAVGPSTVVVSGTLGVALVNAQAALVTCTFGGGCTVTDRLQDATLSLAAPRVPDGVAAAFHTGVSTTHDAGQTWALVQPGVAPDVFGTVAFSPSDATDHTVLLSNDDPRAQSSSKLYLSVDDAATLSAPLAAAGLPAVAGVGASAIQPGGVLMVGLSFAADATGAPRPTGVFCSADSGATFAMC